MSNTFLNIQWITNEALMVLENELSFSKTVNRKYDDMFAREGAKIGYTSNLRLPARYTTTVGQALQIQDFTETQVPVTITTQRHIGVQFSSADLALSLDLFRDRVLKPQIAALANAIDFDGMSLYKDVYNMVGTPGTTPGASSTDAFDIYLSANQRLNEEAAPVDGERYATINPAMERYAVSNLKSLFNPNNDIAAQYRSGRLGRAAGLDFAMGQNVNVHTFGTYSGTPLVNGVPTPVSTTPNTSTIVTDGWTAGAVLKEGDVFTIGTGSAQVFAVNPQSRQSTGALRQFVVAQDATADGSGNMTITVKNGIVASGPYQNVSQLPADNAAITVGGTTGVVTPQAIVNHRDAFALVVVDLPLPGGTDMAARASSKKVNLSIRMVRDYNIQTDQFVCRLDVLYGWKTIRPELACRVAG